MKIHNRSGLRIPRELWTTLAGTLALEGVLPGVSGQDAEMYDGHPGLRVYVASQRTVPKGVRVTCGTYSYGRIILYPCLRCTVGFLTHVFLHELVHAWIHQHHEALYEATDTCLIAESIADAGLWALGGQLGDGLQSIPHRRSSSFVQGTEISFFDRANVAVSGCSAC
jgi:hypothetical protein